MQTNPLLNKVILHNLAGIDKVFSTITISHNTIVKNPLYAVFSNVQSQLNSLYPISSEKEISTEENTYFLTDINHKTAIRIVINTSALSLNQSDPLFLYKSDSLVIQSQKSMILKSDSNIGSSFRLEETNSLQVEVPAYSILFTKYTLN